MATQSASARAARSASEPPWERIVAAAALVSLVLWPVEIHRAFGLPAHPLIIHVPVIFVPILGLAALAAAARPAILARHGVLLGGFAAVSLAATLLAVGAGEAFRDDRAAQGGPISDLLREHAEAGENLRLVMIGFTLVIVLAMLAHRLPGSAVGRLLATGPLALILRGLIAVFAVAAIFFVIRTGHLGAKLAWGQPQGGPPPGFQGRPPGSGG
jgi:hypothetical protein